MRLFLLLAFLLTLLLSACATTQAPAIIIPENASASSQNETIVSSQDILVVENTTEQNVSEPVPPQSKIILWNTDAGGTWMPTGTPPSCAEPLEYSAPVDVGLAASILYPGQVRGGDFKPHGGFRFDDAEDNRITVRAPTDMYVVRGSRYLMDGKVQYLFDFQEPCGIMHRFDHLAALSQQLQELADGFSEPTEGDSRTTQTPPVLIKQGELIATAVGTKENVFVDWGVYDLRKKNAPGLSSQKSVFFDWRNEEDDPLASHALCWLELLPEAEREVVENLPAADGQNGKTSDYC